MFILLTVSCTTLHSERYQNISTFNPRYVRAIHFPISVSQHTHREKKHALTVRLVLLYLYELLFLKEYSSTFEEKKMYNGFFLKNWASNRYQRLLINTTYAGCRESDRRNWDTPENKSNIMTLGRGDWDQL